MLAEVCRHVRKRISSFTGTFRADGTFLPFPRLMETTLRGLRMPDSRLMGGGEVQFCRSCFLVL